ERSKPFFLGAGLFKPHVPLFIPRKYFDLFPIDEIQIPDVNPDDLNDVPEFGKNLAEPDRWHKAVVAADQWKAGVQGYLAAVAFADAQVGRLLDALDNSAHAENTIIVFFGDNGWHLGEKLHWHKLTLWEESARVPLIIATPGMTTRGEDCFRTVSLVDLYPTLIDLCGLPAQAHLEGRSLVPLLEDPKAPWDRPVLTVLQPGSYTIRSERWRYIRYEDGSEELYDHDSDPNEWVNLAGDASCDGVMAALAKWMPDHAADAATVQEKTWKPR
ncbi:MAG: sulfatase-like hydrolase/transferase, partial [Candidatus Hydrogenedentes bacterium]|nr:sulfatase-like hydrolase/transferase [Candidatus Hydrogenedentota bacterium]